MELSSDQENLQPQTAGSHSHPREPTFTIFADRYGPAAELAGLRQSFTAAAVSHAISVDRRHGIITLVPQGTTLRVGSEADEYVRIRVVERSMGYVGMMVCSSDGMVSWRAAATRDLPAQVA
ncbi:MAG TPA: hypothetical protein VHE11_07460 [Steroidobacteraceae bacterium]|nr:hypothetical protein [Steroidobacteraceae bacterium]